MHPEGSPTSASRRGWSGGSFLPAAPAIVLDGADARPRPHPSPDGPRDADKAQRHTRAGQRGGPAAPPISCWRRSRPLKEESLMQVLTSKIRRFLASDDGPTAVEYAVMLALILVACITIVKTLGTSLSNTFDTVNTSVS